MLYLVQRHTIFHLGKDSRQTSVSTLVPSEKGQYANQNPTQQIFLTIVFSILRRYRADYFTFSWFAWEISHVWIQSSFFFSFKPSRAHQTLVGKASHIRPFWREWSWTELIEVTQVLLGREYRCIGLVDRPGIRFY